MRAKILFSFLFTWSFQFVFAQNLYFEHINEKKGLPQLGIKAIHLGPTGYIWISAGYGLYRFDGHVYETYYETEPGPEKTGEITSIHSNYKRIVALTDEKIIIIHTLNQKVEELVELSKKIKKPKTILTLKDNILIGAENGLWSYDLKSKTFKNIGIYEPISNIESNGNGRVIIASCEAFYIYYPFNQKLVKTQYKHVSFIQNFTLGSNLSLTWIEADNTFHFGHLKFNNLIEDKNWQLTSSITEVNCMGKFNQEYYIGTDNGLLRINQNGKEELLDHQEGEYFSLSQNQVCCLLADRLNNLWIGTKTGGINIYNGFKHKFNLICPDISSRFKNCKEILSFAETPKKNILFLSETIGIGEFDPKENTIKNQVPLNFIGNCILQNKQLENSFLIGSKLGLHLYNHQTGKLEFTSTINKNKNFESDIKCIVPERDLTYWMGGNDGFFLFDLKSKITLANYDISNTNLGSENIRDIVRKSENELFICTTKGLYLFNIKNKNFKLIPINGNAKQPFVSNIKKDKKGRLWIGTSGEGLNVILENNESKNLNIKNGLLNNQVYALEFDKDETQCWISTNKGLSSINMTNFEIKNHTLIDGLQGNEFNESSSILTNEGTLYFGGVNGFNCFDPKFIKNNPLECVTRIKGLAILNKNEGIQSYYTIPSEKNFISIDFVALNYYLNENPTYLYQLEGLEDKWIDNGTRQFASFGELNPGDYIFKVKAKNIDGKISSNIDKLYFTVKPAIHERLWFKLISTLLFAGAIAFIIYFRIKNAITEEQEKSKQNQIIGELKLKALRAQMNPHFIFNSLNSIQDFVLNNEKQLASKYLSKIAKLIRMILDISEQTFTSIDSKIEFLKLYIDLENLRLNNTITCSFEVDSEIDKEALIPTLLIQPHIENAIWHGLQYKVEEKSLKISMVKKGENLIQVIVEDNGIGRAAAMKIKKEKTPQHQSQGLKKTEERFEVLKKYFGSYPKIEIIDMFDENKLACGTKVILQIPTKYG